MNIGRIVRHYRISKNILQGEMAEKIGITQNYLSLVENGKRNLSAPSIKNFAKSMHVSESALILIASETPEELTMDDKENFIKLQKNLLSLLIIA